MISVYMCLVSMTTVHGDEASNDNNNSTLRGLAVNAVPTNS